MYNIAQEILDKLGEETLMRELAKVTDEFGISRDLLTQSDSCDFKSFNLDTPALEIADEPEIKTTTDPNDANAYFCPAELKPELVAALKDIYVADTFAEPDAKDNVPIIPAVDFFAFAAPLYLTDICTTAYRKNVDGSFTEDTAAFNRLEAIETKIFQINESAPKHESEAARNARIDGYLNTAYNLEGMAEELEIICDNFDDDARDEKDRHVASRISFYVEHVKRGIEGLREMIDWYIQHADFA